MIGVEYKVHIVVLVFRLISVFVCDFEIVLWS